MAFTLFASDSHKLLVAKCQAEITTHIGFCTFLEGNSAYIPPHAIEVVATERNISAVIDKDDSIGDVDFKFKRNFARQVYDAGKKLFIICLMQNLDMNFLYDMLNVADFGDDCLPLAPEAARDEFELDETAFKKVLLYQHLVTSPYLKEGVYDRRIKSLASVPIRTDKMLGKGASGVVYSIRIDKDCFYFPNAGVAQNNPDRWSRGFAMKSIGSLDDASREVQFVKALYEGKVRHPNLLPCHTGFINGHTLYLISDRADHDIEHMLNKTELRDYNGADQKWLHTQFLGLAEALERIQNIAETGKAGYVHDIKPPNVLVCTTPTPVLKLTDWGRAKISYLSGNNSHKTNTMGDNAYHPPECDEGDEGHSRPYDVWSLGCLFIDLMVWFNEGTKGYKSFLEKRKNNPEPEEDSFHYYNKVKSSVVKKMKQLSKDESGWKDVVEIVEKMLEVKPEERLTAVQVVERLQIVGI